MIPHEAAAQSAEVGVVMDDGPLGRLGPAQTLNEASAGCGKSIRHVLLTCVLGHRIVEEVSMSARCANEPLHVFAMAVSRLTDNQIDSRRITVARPPAELCQEDVFRPPQRGG